MQELLSDAREAGRRESRTAALGRKRLLDE
jgi:hypothetical protein